MDVHFNGDCKLKGRLVIWELRFYQKQIITVLYIIHLNGGRNITFFSHDNFLLLGFFCGMAIYGMFVLYSLMQRWFVPLGLLVAGTSGLGYHSALLGSGTLKYHIIRFVSLLFFRERTMGCLLH